MNLLVDDWIPVKKGKIFCKINLKALLCKNNDCEICLPRDDMEFACLQLLVCLVQVMFIPADKNILFHRIKEPLAEKEYDAGIEKYVEWFDLCHQKYPFMQVRGVKAKELTEMDKLFSGLSGATNCCFINHPNLAEQICPACCSIVLFNQANNAPSFGGGFKGSLRGSSPITTLIRGRSLRETVWLNIVSIENIRKILPWYDDTLEQKPNWVEKIKSKDILSAQSIGLLRGLFWQPAHIELVIAQNVSGKCCCCGQDRKMLFKGFLKEKFNYTLDGNWPHPHSPRITKITKSERNEKFLSFTTTSPAWTQLGKFVLLKHGEKEGQSPAAVVCQAEEIIRKGKLNLLVGGYRNNQASILERRHDLISLSEGWQEHPEILASIVETALGYKTALRKALYVFFKGFSNKDDLKGSGIDLCNESERRYYNLTEQFIHSWLISVDVEHPQEVFQQMEERLGQFVYNLFDDLTNPYRGEPKLLKILSVSRKILIKHVNELKQGGLDE